MATCLQVFEKPHSAAMLKRMSGIDPNAKFNLQDSILSEYGSLENLIAKAKRDRDWEAQVQMSYAYQYGIAELNIEPDLDQAIGWMESSLNNGNRSALDQFYLGVLHDTKGTIPNQRRAFELYMEAARFGVVNAVINIAEVYRCGIEGVVNEDLEESFKWYKYAAGEETDYPSDDRDTSHKTRLIRGTMKNMDIDCQFLALRRLHKYYLAGECPEGKPQPVKALLYQKRAAELGDTEAQKDLGITYLTGKPGEPINLDQAKRWLEKAADKGNSEAKEILKKFENSIVEVPNAANPHISESNVIQCFEMLKMNLQQNQSKHPYVINNPMVFQESMFTQYPESPTAQHYLKAFRLVKKGVEELQKSNFTDPAGITLIAYGYLYENSILQSFPDIHLPHFLPSIFILTFEKLKTNSNFFEGLLLMIVLSQQVEHISMKSCKMDLTKVVSLNNLIHLIKNSEPNKLPQQNPYLFEQNYSSWLHVLYYYSASLYTIAKNYSEGADAFQNALKCCPSYFEAKLGMGFCLMSLISREQHDSSSKVELLEPFALPKQPRIAKDDYLTWTQAVLREKAKQLFMEYLQEAPVCDKKYPNCHYHLSTLFMTEGNIEETIRWKERGEDSEEKRLHFMEPVQMNIKNILSMLDIFPLPKNISKCNNKTCPNKAVKQGEFKTCPCKKALYCGSECQKVDWKVHKNTCSCKKTKKKKEQ